MQMSSAYTECPRAYSAKLREIRPSAQNRTVLPWINTTKSNHPSWAADTISRDVFAFNLMQFMHRHHNHPCSISCTIKPPARCDYICSSRQHTNDINATMSIYRHCAWCTIIIQNSTARKNIPHNTQQTLLDAHSPDTPFLSTPRARGISNFHTQNTPESDRIITIPLPDDAVRHIHRTMTVLTYHNNISQNSFV